jgi:hypothetical protein
MAPVPHIEVQKSEGLMWHNPAGLDRHARRAPCRTWPGRGTRMPPIGVGAVLLAGLLTGYLSVARAQDIEPRAYANAPIGVNFLIGGYAFTRGALATDTAVPVTDARFTTSNALLGYVRVLDLWGQSAKFDVVVPYSWLSGSANYRGESFERLVDGFGDPRFRLSVNLYGAPALTLKEFSKYHQDLIVGASLQVSAPLGQYDNSRVVNLGTNRWFVKPEIGVSQALGPWTLELAGAATLFTDNPDFFNGRTRSQEPLYSLQGHLIYAFRSGIWASFDATYFTGGRTTLEDVLNNDLQRNWRLGTSLSLPLDRLNSIKLYASSGVDARTGNNFDLLGISWQYRWGGGL